MAFTGWQNLVVCGYDPSTKDPGIISRHANHYCGFSDMVLVVQNVITDLIILGVAATTLVAIFAGFKLITSQGNPGAMKEAKSMLMNVVKGFVVMISAWLVVHLIASALLVPGYSLL